MPGSKIEGGYILLSRKIIESEIWRKPPLYLKVWIWLLERAQHKEYKQLKRGQLFVSISDIRTGVAWYVGCRKETPTKDQIFQILEWMRNPYESNLKATMKAPMIATTKATHGMVIEILNYEHYQNPKNYESNNESNNEQTAKAIRKQRQPNNINKNDKNVKNEKNISNTDFSNHDFSETAKAKIEEWLTYKKERKENYKPTGLNSLLTQIENNISTYGEQKVIDLISECMAAGYKGIIWDKLKKPQNQGKPAHRDNFQQHNYNDDFYDKLQKIGG